MATASFQFHGPLSEFIERARRGRASDYSCAGAATLTHVIEALGVPHTETGTVVVNGGPATLSRTVRDGDTVEVFPRRPADEETGRVPLFVADAHLGGLARMLRMLGCDTAYAPAIHDDEMVAMCSREGRVVLTRDRELLKRRDVLRGCFGHARKSEPQLIEVAARYSLAERSRPFTLCLHCNLALRRALPAEVAVGVPERVRERHADFMRCPACERLYWKGSHWHRMLQMLESALPGLIVRDADTGKVRRL